MALICVFQCSSVSCFFLSAFISVHQRPVFLYARVKRRKSGITASRESSPCFKAFHLAMLLPCAVLGPLGAQGISPVGLLLFLGYAHFDFLPPSDSGPGRFRCQKAARPARPARPARSAMNHAPVFLLCVSNDSCSGSHSLSKSGQSGQSGQTARNPKTATFSP